MRWVILLLSSVFVVGEAATVVAADQVVQVNSINNKVIDVTDLSNNRRKVLRLSPNITVKFEETRNNSRYHVRATLRDVRPGTKVVAFGVDYDTVFDIVIER